METVVMTGTIIGLLFFIVAGIFVISKVIK